LSVPRTLESNRALSEFDVVAFSISFENDYPNLLAILDGAKIPFFSSRRERRHPFILAGGVACFINPEPLADFIDCFVIGEAEPVLERFFEIFDPAEDRLANLKNLVDHVQGVYVPAFYSVAHNPDGTIQSVVPVHSAPEKVKRVYATDLSTYSTTSVVISPHTSFGRTFLIETGRGCPHGCRFCTAGYVYRPPRFRSFTHLAHDLEQGAARTDRIGLVGAAITDLPDLKSLCDHVKDKPLRVSFSSLRADRLTDEVIAVLQQSRVKTATIAPDAGSERMRQVIKKGIHDADILSSAKRLVAAGIPNLKLYFMVGLPTETLDDVEEIVLLCQRVKQVFLMESRVQKRIGTITVSVNPFVPKPFTPFQWAAMDDMKTIKQKVRLIAEGLKSMANVRLISESPREAFVQGLLARGDRRMGEFLVNVHRNANNWTKTLKAGSRTVGEEATRVRMQNERLPWQVIDNGVQEGFLASEYEKAKGFGPD
jgi:radical SAM superfamily enzyme YgiQ (UPF0313 family)